MFSKIKTVVISLKFLTLQVYLFTCMLFIVEWLMAMIEKFVVNKTELYV